jgi:Polycystin domain
VTKLLAKSNQSVPGRAEQLLRGVRVRQLRVKPSTGDECDRFPFMRSHESDALCSKEYSAADEQQDDMDPCSRFGKDVAGNGLALNALEATLSAALLRNVSLSRSIFHQAFCYRSMSELRDVLFWGRALPFTTAYNGGGFAFDLLRGDKDIPAGQDPVVFYLDNLRALQHLDWLDYQTRAVVVDIPVWNPSITRFGLVRNVLELPAAGGFVPVLSITVSQLWCWCSLDQDVTVAVLGSMAIFLGIGSLYAPTRLRRKVVLSISERSERLVRC